MKGVWKFVGGCFVGAASAIVVSPKSGSELRRQMALRLAHGLERAAGETPPSKHGAAVDSAGPAAAGSAKPGRAGKRPPAAAPVTARSVEQVPSAVEPRAVVYKAAPESPVAVGAPRAAVSAEVDRPSVGPPAHEPPSTFEPPAYEPPPAFEPPAYEPPAPPPAFEPAAYEPPVFEPPAEETAPAAIEDTEAVEAGEEPVAIGEPETAADDLLSSEAPTSLMEQETAQVVEPEPTVPIVRLVLDEAAAPIETPEAESEGLPVMEMPPAAEVSKGPETLAEAFVEAPAWLAEDTAIAEPVDDLTDEWTPAAAPARPETAALEAAAQSAAALEASPTADESEAAAAEAGIADLRARIEQTKAAVRQALEHPFVAEDGVAPPLDESPLVSEEPLAVQSPLPAEEPNALKGASAVEPFPVAFQEETTAGPIPTVVAQEPTAIREDLPIEPLETSPIESLEEPVFPGVDIGGASPEQPAERRAVDADFDAFRAAFAEGDDAGVWVSPESEEGLAVAEEHGEDVITVRTTSAAVPEQSPLAVAGSPVDAPAATAEPAAQESVLGTAPGAAVVDQAEMRRRIEETRNRLKAKAFDAMASGESALLGREAVEQAPASDVDERLDDDVRTVIDRSLSQDDY